MKFVIEGTFLVEAGQLGDINEVESTGDWRNEKYKITGEPTNVKPVKDADILHDEDFDAHKNDQAAKELEKVQKELDEFKLQEARRKAIDRIANEKRGVSREEIEAWANTQTSVYFIGQGTTDDVRKHMRSEEK